MRHPAHTPSRSPRHKAPHYFMQPQSPLRIILRLDLLLFLLWAMSAHSNPSTRRQPIRICVGGGESGGGVHWPYVSECPRRRNLEAVVNVLSLTTSNISTGIGTGLSLANDYKPRAHLDRKIPRRRILSFSSLTNFSFCRRNAHLGFG